MIRAALEGVANPALDALGSTFGGAWGPDLVIGMMKHAVGQMAAWAGARDSAANAAGPVVGGPFLGTPGAIGYPLNPWVVTSEFGMRGGVPHQGIDLGAPLGQAVMAAAAGSVARSGWYGGYGNSIMLDHGGGLATTYSHLSDLIATAGQIVSAGEVIGRVGSTGDSTGPHLHFETLSGGGFVNPREFLAFDRGGYLPTGVSAVYNGTGSPEPVFTDRQWQTMGAGQSGGPTINITNIYPQAEPTSVTTSRALRQYSMVGGL
jgi:murein DD-endopeptidase MepM/ murein hydrolase activator NlpD